MRRALISLGLFFAFVVIVTLIRHHPPAATTTTSTSTSTSTTTPSTTTTIAGPAACQGSDFTGTFNLAQGAAGTISTSATLVKTTAGTCTLDGWPVLGLRSASGAVLPEQTVDVPTAGNPAGFIAGAANQPPKLLTLVKGSSTTFSVAYSDVLSGAETTCPNAAVVSVATSAGGPALSITLAYPIAPCDGGLLRVSPFY